MKEVSLKNAVAEDPSDREDLLRDAHVLTTSRPDAVQETSDVPTYQCAKTLDGSALHCTHFAALGLEVRAARQLLGDASAF